MKVIHRDGDYVKQHNEIKRNGVIKAGLKNLLLIGETSYEEYTLSDDNVGYVENLNARNETHFLQ